MRFVILMSTIFLIPVLSAQSIRISEGFSPRWSVGVDYLTTSSNEIQITPRVGFSAEYELKPHRSIWTSFRFKQMDWKLSFTGDLGPGITGFYSELYPNAQKYYALRAGFRTYLKSRRESWFFWYAPVVGFQQVSFTSDFRKAVRETELPPRDRFAYNELLARSTSVFELGSDIGARWSFTRRFYLEGNMMFLGQYFTTIEDLAFEPIVRFGLGVKF